MAREGMEFIGSGRHIVSDSKPSIYVVQAEELAKSFPFDGFQCTNTIGFAGVKVRGSNSLWLLSAIYASPRRGFVDLFSTSHLHDPSGFSLPPWAPRVSDLEALSINTPVSAKDIKSCLWSFKPFKAPGPDGLHPGFFQKCWNTVGESVINEVKQIFISGKMPPYLNKTLISLIPKCLGPETLSQFRPISLCNTVYKIVTKIIVCRIRPIIGNLVSPYQAAFVPGRRGIDNVIIAQEIIHSMHRKKGRVGQLVLKLDLEKAYDRLEWSFIQALLVLLSFLESMHFGYHSGTPKEGYPVGVFQYNPRMSPLWKVTYGFPDQEPWASTRDFDFVVEKVQAKLSSWKGRLLSPAVRTSPRILFFLWQCYHLSVPVRETLAARGINTLTFCPRCLGPNESLLHVLRDCPDSISFWKSFRFPSVGNNFYSASLFDWLHHNCLDSSTHDHNIPWQTIFSFGVWNLWLRRNQFVFKPDSPFLDPVRSTISFASEFFYLIGNFSKAKHVVSVPVKWATPPLGWFKLNTDGSSLGNPGLAGGGGVIRNHLGDWVGGYSRAIGHTTSVQAELRALKDGLILAIDIGILNLEIEMDSLVAVELLKSITSPNAFLSSIVIDCRYLMERFEHFSLKHIFREANGCADLLAKAGCDQLLDFISFPNASAHVLEALAFDVSNATCFRLINS
uniref:RNase H type-1 domain-containing protein n=1 Tax=Fagus sylvatica TaxID=28930 RepID=A0A2N9I4P7_FAGSY